MINNSNFEITDQEGTYKFIKVIPAELIAEDTSYIEVHYCDTEFNRINISTDGYSYPPFIWNGGTNFPYFLDSAFAHN